MMQDYELMILYKPLLLEDIKKNTISKLETFIESNKGKLVEEENLGKRLLAYPIKKFEEGHYLVYTLSFDPDKVSELERELRLSDNVLRYLIINKEKN